ncbi:hypothetical protein ECMP0209401_3573 [Escherichia coli MP020940.1]|nr:hypothetical protein ECMP0209401_3573 [Escherichia coli MP020940.1]
MVSGIRIKDCDMIIVSRCLLMPTGDIEAGKTLDITAIAVNDTAIAV